MYRWYVFNYFTCITQRKKLFDVRLHIYTFEILESRERQLINAPNQVQMQDSEIFQLWTLLSSSLSRLCWPVPNLVSVPCSLLLWPVLPFDSFISSGKTSSWYWHLTRAFSNNANEAMFALTSLGQEQKHGTKQLSS